VASSRVAELFELLGLDVERLLQLATPPVQRVRAVNEKSAASGSAEIFSTRAATGERSRPFAGAV